ncbi:vacuolar protein sorting-associated protein 13C, partial [Clonorchis sinensis]
MVFESLIVDLINKYAGDYIEALNASQLKIGLLGGNAQLENLDIKPNAFDSLNLPVKVLQGHISGLYCFVLLVGSLTLKIPFKNLYTEPTVAELDGLYVLVVPNS